MTGQYSHINGAKTLSGRLSPETDNVAKNLQTSGYQTAMVGKWHLKDKPAGFNYYNVLRGQGRYNNPILFEKGKDWKNGGEEHTDHSTDVIAEIALNWLKSHTEPEEPFFLMCHFKAVHEPFYSHDRFRSLFKDQDLPVPDDLLWPESPENKRFDGWPLEILKDRYLERPDHYSPPPLKLLSKNREKIRETTYQKFIKDYLRAVAGIDHNVGKLLSYLEKTGRLEDTIIIYTSDQGYFLGEHNLFDKRFMLEESLRMPFLIRYPREIRPGTVVDDIILNIDFAELFLDYADIVRPTSMQGQSFRPNLGGRTPANWRKDMYYHYWTHQPQRPSHYGIRTHSYKLIYYYGLVKMGRKPEKCWEFYDLETDPHERTNRYDDSKYYEVITRLKRRLVELRKEYKDTELPITK